MRKLFFPAAGLLLAILLGLSGAIYAPDAGQYRLLALGQRSAVPAPFSARILGPAIAGWTGRVSGLGIDSGFLALGVVCLVALIAVIAAILWSWRAPAVLFAGIFLMPFWVDLFHDYYLPDLLHATLLAAILFCLLRGQSTLAMLLLLPAYLARESTLLVALCLIFACWRRIPLRAVLAGVGAVVAAILISKHYGHGGPASVHGLGGGAYIGGKLIWSFFKNVLGLPLYSNTLPECNPVWVHTLRHPLGAIRTVGFMPAFAVGAGTLIAGLVRDFWHWPRPGAGLMAEDCVAGRLHRCAGRPGSRAAFLPRLWSHQPADDSPCSAPAATAWWNMDGRFILSCCPGSCSRSRVELFGYFRCTW